MEVGQPSSSAPLPVLNKARDALTTSKIGYTNALGTSVLRQKIANYYSDKYNVTIPPDSGANSSDNRIICRIRIIFSWLF